MSFRARTAENVKQGKLGNGQILEIDGTAFGPQLKRYRGNLDHGNDKLTDSRGRPFGAPTPAMLASDLLIVRTCAGDRPWPGSSEDRHGKGEGKNGMENALRGAVSPFGVWPDHEEKVVQANTTMATEDPRGYAERVMTQRPYSEGEKAVVRARVVAVESGMDAERFQHEALDVGAVPLPGGDPPSPSGLPATSSQPQDKADRKQQQDAKG